MLNSSDLLSKPVEELKNIVKEKRKSGSDEDRERARVKREKLEAETAEKTGLDQELMQHKQDREAAKQDLAKAESAARTSRGEILGSARC